MYEAERAKLIADLGLEHWTFRWVFVNARDLPYRRTRAWGLHTTLGNNSSRIEVALRRASYLDVLTTIAHELRHAWQDANNVNRIEWIKLRTRQHPKHIWSGSQYIQACEYVHKKSSRWDLPEEIDARAYATDAVRRLFPDMAPQAKSLSPEAAVKKLFAGL
jgi:hypothetical protein